MHILLKLSMIAAALVVGILGTWTVSQLFASQRPRASAVGGDVPRGVAFRDTREAEPVSVAETGSLRASLEDVALRVSAGTSGQARMSVVVAGTDEQRAHQYLEALDPRLETGPRGVRLAIGSTRGLRDYWKSGARTWVSLEVRLPPAYGVDVETDDGAVSVNGLAGSVEVRTDDGEIEALNLDGPALSIETSDGKVTARGIEAARQRIRTSDAPVAIESVQGDLAVSTHGGDIDAHLETPAAVELRSQDGDIRIALAPEVGIDLTAEGRRVEIDDSLDLRGSESGSRATGLLNRGGAPLVASSNHGLVSLKMRR